MRRKCIFKECANVAISGICARTVVRDTCDIHKGDVYEEKASRGHRKSKRSERQAKSSDNAADGRRSGSATLSAGSVCAYSLRQRQSSNVSRQRAASSNNKAGASYKRRGADQSCTRGGGSINAFYRTFVRACALCTPVFTCVQINNGIFFTRM